MANKKFTEQEMLMLRNSKYVLDVSPSIVHFSAEFKKLFWKQKYLNQIEKYLSDFDRKFCSVGL